ncbi:GNAT family N-acetyltransferase [Haloplasma contractile]|uniref:Phospholipiddiacylglycerol acyltransferase protein n=1 Tax=Haloplasma contractile SSD-17B TaxID=1033810 RepID=U2EBI3_9MOLU|nr:GNAT family N-acetyltransferase [Haloplasma contractile]ERJ12438.1 phospholipiddiacylglycerol acyltransferase protein [Haloplasma contractile SSD-17B]
MIRRAQYEDINIIMEIISETVDDLENEGNKQWSESYPAKKHFIQDIMNDSLYVYLLEDNIAGVISLNSDENIEYKDAKWRLDQKALVIHRFAVRKAFRRRKVGTNLVQFAETKANKECLNYVKVDTNSKNSRMNALFKHLNYQFCGEIYMGGLKDPFNCYDKILK